MKTVTMYNAMLAVFFLAISYLHINSKIDYGVGLGGLFYLYLSVLGLILLLPFIFIKKLRKLSALTSILFSSLILYLIYSFTIGRGLENPWNGIVFF